MFSHLQNDLNCDVHVSFIPQLDQDYDDIFYHYNEFMENQLFHEGGGAKDFLCVNTNLLLSPKDNVEILSKGFHVLNRHEVEIVANEKDHKSNKIDTWACSSFDARCKVFNLLM